ncbi:conserved hypothetical protein [Frankia canadensis]|uniref:Uncharacterized protein n=1 Tax=Frankia canadensis TaxID=1836972 RepID=A0A2I2KSM6_9ACTN|nr:conserved hypothetical protein [Frankia canadensis]SOU55926.1 conserved hypothetical protein [Frankia canadensis]
MLVPRRRAPNGPVRRPPLSADLTVVVLTHATTIVARATLLSVTMITICVGVGGVPAVVAALVPTVMAPLTLALPAAIRDVQRRGDGAGGGGRRGAVRCGRCGDPPSPRPSDGSRPIPG